MNEFEQGVEYTDDNLVTMVEEDQAAVEEAAGGADHDYMADTAEGATDGEMLEDDGEVVDEGGREGAKGTPRTAIGKGSYLKNPTPRYNSPGQVAGRIKNNVGKAVNGVANTASNMANTTAGELASGAKSAVGSFADKVKGASISSVGNAIKNNKGKAGLAAGAAGAVAAGLGAKAMMDKNKDDRQGGRFGGEEEMLEETVAAPVNYADPVEANYASIQSAVNYAMQDHRL